MSKEHPNQKSRITHYASREMYVESFLFLALIVNLGLTSIRQMSFTFQVERLKVDAASLKSFIIRRLFE